MKRLFVFFAALLLGSMRTGAQSAGGLTGRTFQFSWGPWSIEPVDPRLTDTSGVTFLQTGPIDYSGNFEGNIPGIIYGGDYFAVVWEGWFNAGAGGSGDYTFGTESDDGSLIYLDLNSDGDFADSGEKVVNNNGVHGTQQQTSTVNLQMDYVRIAIAFYEQTGGERMVARFGKGTGLGFNALTTISGGDPRFTTAVPALGSAYAGLWVGQASLNEVKEAATGVWSAAPAFSETVLLHVGSDGNVVLLSEATLMQTRQPAPPAPAEVPVPVIVTQPALLANYDGITPRGGRRIGQRFSTATMPLPADRVALTRSLPRTGSEAVLGGSFSLPAAHPLNPFRHKYHPDLTNGRALTRTVSLSLLLADSPSDHVITGTLTESFTGLHKLTLEARGPVTFTRVSTSGKLNQP